MFSRMFLIIGIAVSFTACQSPNPSPAPSSGATVPSLPVSANNTTTAQNAQKILEGTYQLKMDEQTSAILDSVLSESPQQRQYYFGVYRKMLAMGESEADDMLGSFTKVLLLQQPAETLQNIQVLPAAEQKKFVSYLAYEFMNSGNEYLNDINTYFADVAAECPMCNSNDLATLKRRLIEEVKSTQ